MSWNVCGKKFWTRLGPQGALLLMTFVKCGTSAQFLTVKITINYRSFEDTDSYTETLRLYPIVPFNIRYTDSL